MKKLLCVTLFVLLLVGCGKKPPVETTAVTEIVPPAITTEATAETEEIEITPPPSIVQETDALPADAAEAMLTAHPVGGNPKFYVFEKGLTYYVQVLGDPITMTVVSLSKCTLSLPEGYTDGEIVDGSSGAGSGEVVLTVSANKNGKTIYLDYLFYVDDLVNPAFVWAEENTPIRP